MNTLACCKDNTCDPLKSGDFNKKTNPKLNVLCFSIILPQGMGNSLIFIPKNLQFKKNQENIGVFF